MSNAVSVCRWARYTLEAFTTPEQFASPQEYLAALDECLVELCEINGVEPPNLDGVWS